MKKIFTPKPYQQTGIDHLGDHPIGALFAGMGLGKTAMVLARLSQDIADGSCKGALVIAPLRVSLFTWLDEVAKWHNFSWMRIVSLRTPEGMAAWHRGDACIYTLNYESIYIPRTARDGTTVDHGIIRKILHGKHPDDLPVDTIVWDELSKAKDPKSKRIQFFRKYRSKFKRHWGLTGTPIPNSHQDLFAQIRLLDDGALFGKHIGNFRQQYLEPVDFHERQWRVRADCEGMIEQKLLAYVLTLRSEDHLDIPPVTVEDVPVSLPPAVRVK
jgi:SNF2 family DNA or RNA helicase